MYLAEWKQPEAEPEAEAIQVLIVPCGMETGLVIMDSYCSGCINCTLRNGNLVRVRYHPLENVVLIVPCGMETKEDYTSARGRELY